MSDTASSDVQLAARVRACRDGLTKAVADARKAGLKVKIEISDNYASAPTILVFIERRL